ncbi:LOW QUALITY PROTEIN: hypothetical protein HJC23_006744 [Cyclotella cryptica]|uniref:Acyltransferase n=1 Tax=Cyclotella cryptica TaxID=29204 RepID=A0ABD3PR16_9STRA
MQATKPTMAFTITEPAPASTTDDGTPSSNNNNIDPSKWKVHETPQDAGLMSTIAVTLFLGWNGILMGLVLYFVLIAKEWERLLILGLGTLSLVLPHHYPPYLGYKIGDWMVFQAEKYFGLKTIIENEQQLLDFSDKNKSVIFAFEPHDIIPYAVFAFSPSLKRIPGKIGEDGCCLMSSAIFRTPFLRNVYSWARSFPVDKSTFLERLRCGKSLTFIPGGVQEIFMLDPMNPRDLVLYLKKRKGFVKLALQTGSPIVPVFGFHLDGSYGYWLPKGRWMELYARYIGYFPLLFWGRWFIPYGIPYPKKIQVVVGSAMDIPRLGNNDISQDIIDKYHGIFLKEMEALFERHKQNAGYGDCHLKIC